MRDRGRKLRVGIVGATGAVGEVLLRVLEERALPIDCLRALASARSAGQKLSFRGDELEVAEARPEAFDGLDLVFFAATGSLSRELAPAAVERGAVVIDKSGTWRMDERVPLVVPEVNARALDSHEGIIASPNCTTVGIVMALAPLDRAARVKNVVITSLQAVSGAGREGTDELERQLDPRCGEPRPEIFAAPIAHNLVPQCDELGADGFTAEELKLVRETRKILANPTLEVAATCVRVPVPVGHSATLLVDTEVPLEPERAREALRGFPGVLIFEDPAFPTPREVAGSDDVHVGRLRSDPGSGRLWLWVVSDNLRKGAATNAVQIAEALLERGSL